MNIVLALDSLSLTLVIVSSAVFFILLLVLLYFLFVRNRALTHQVKELNRRYEYLHSLLVNQDSKHLEHIEEISQVNLLYSPIYDKQIARLNHLRDDKDIYAGEKMAEFNEAVNGKRYKTIRKEISDFKHFMNEFEDDVNKLNNDLLQIIRPEEECNQMLFDAKGTFSNIKQEYTLHLSDLSLLKKSYNEVFKLVEKQFIEFMGYVEKANYEDANNLMPSINKILSELQTINKVMPKLCILASREIPLRLSDLESEYKRLDMESYPLYHIVTPKQITKLRDEVKDIVKELKSFNYRGQEEKLKFINARIDDYLFAFQKERDDRKVFEQEEAPTYQRVTKIEKDFIKLCNSIPKIQKVYAINDEKVSSRNKIQNHINRIGVSKRSLETFVHTVGKRQPYSALLARTMELKQEVDQVENEMLEFKNYLTSLKEDVEKAYDLVSKYYYRVRRAEKILRDIAIPSVSEKYKAKVDDIYQHLEKINTTAMVLPIQVHEINEAVNFLNFEGESILNQIDQEDTMLKLAESSLIYINKDRANFPELNNLVKQNEKSFFEGEFEKAYNDTSKIIKRYAELEE
ncbi:MAG: septation ring formation regulator EzrA [Bacilli bacterium]|nr:septation ring formation regulator EzrA [Bacilli bacterium]